MRERIIVKPAVQSSSSGSKSQRVAVMNRNLEFWTEVVGPHFQLGSRLPEFDRDNQSAEIGELGEYYESVWARQELERPVKRRRRTRYLEPLTSRRGVIEYSIDLVPKESKPKSRKDVLPYLVMRCFVSKDPVTARGIVDPIGGRLEILGVEPRPSDFMLDYTEQDDVPGGDGSTDESDSEEAEFSLPSEDTTWITKRGIRVKGRFICKRSTAVR